MDIRVSSVSYRELCCLPGRGATRLVGLALACPKSMYIFIQVLADEAISCIESFFSSFQEIPFPVIIVHE